MFNRIFVGIFLAIFIYYCLYNKYKYFMFFVVNISVMYDCVYLWTNYIQITIIITLFILMFFFNLYLLYLYEANEQILILLIAMSQISDAYQYIFGIHFGINRIGWLSKHKTYEGYIGGFILTYLTFCYKLKFIKILFIYLLGITGGLLSSLFKRYIGIKDYSNLLGAHGGWLDRIDSIILPCLIGPSIIYHETIDYF